MNYENWEHLVPEALRELIYEALKNKDEKFIRGIECFAGISSWDDIAGIARIIATLFEKMIWAKEEAEKIKNRIEKEYPELSRLGIIENLEKNREKYENRWIKKENFIEAVITKEVHSGKTHREAKRVVFERIEALEKHNFVEEDESGEFIRLSEIWFKYLDDIMTKEKTQQGIYIWAIGKIIGHALVGEIRYGEDNEKIIRPFKVLRNVVNVAAKNDPNNPKIKEEEIIDYFIAEHGVKPNRWVDFKQQDKMKASDIRAITGEKDGYIYFNREMARANELINKRVNELWQQRQRGNAE